MDKKYSQLDDQEYIVEFFKDTTGRFLDIGAFDGIIFSNTYQLVLNGWSGVSFDPSTIYDILKENLKDYPVECVKCGLGFNDGEITFWDGEGNALSTSEKWHMKMWKKANAKFTKTTIKTMSWDTILDTYGTDFDLINIDAEGNSVDLFKKLPYERLPNLKMIIVEYDERPDEVQMLGFKELHRNALNILLVKE